MGPNQTDINFDRVGGDADNSTDPAGPAEPLPRCEDDELIGEPDQAAIDPSGPQRVCLRMRRRLPGRRLDKYLHGRLPRVSRTTIQRLIRDGLITVNGRPTKPSYEPDGGDILELVLPPPEPYEVAPEEIPLNILHEDDEVLVLNKPPGIICHPARSTQRGTIANALAFYCRSLSRGEDAFRPGIVHRLDKNTTGVMIVAKTDEAHWRLALQFERRTTRKTYIAIVHGEPERDADVIDAPIGHHATVHDRYVVTGIAERLGGRFEKSLGKQAVTHYRVLERFNGYGLVELTPKTGRTHQLRVHMSYVGHPIVGDPFYGGRHVSRRLLTGRAEESDELFFTRQALHAHRLAVVHPGTHQPLEVTAPLPADMEELLAILRQYRGRTH